MTWSGVHFRLELSIGSEFVLIIISLVNYGYDPSNGRTCTQLETKLEEHAKPYNLSDGQKCVRFLDWSSSSVRVQELCESRGGRLGLPVLMNLKVCVDVKQH